MIRPSFTLVLLLSLLVSTLVCHAQQRFFAEKSFISFFSDGVIEDITAKNEKVTSIFDVIGGDIAYLMSVKDFQFDKALMQTHFNEKYAETEKFPKASFQGKISGFSFSAAGKQQVRASGKLTIHGVSQNIDVPGTIEVNGNRISLKSKFMIKLSDYNIKIPQIVWQNIAQQVEVTLDFLYRPL